MGMAAAVCAFAASTVDLSTLTQRRGEEFPGTRMSYRVDGAGGHVKIDFTNGGRYGAMERRLDGKWGKLEKVELDLQTSAKLLQFRVQDSAGRIYQRNLTLSGDGSQRQSVVIDRFYGSKAEGFDQWGKGTANSFVEPAAWYSLVFSRDNGTVVEATIHAIREFGQESAAEAASASSAVTGPLVTTEADLKTFVQRRGEEFPGTRMSYRVDSSGGHVKVDFTNGGRYGAMERRVDGQWARLGRVELDLQTSAKLLQFRVQDAAGRIYQRNLTLTGDGSRRQSVVVDRLYGSKAEGFDQWGKGTANRFVDPAAWYSLVFSRDNGTVVEATILAIRESGVEKVGIGRLMRPSDFRIVPGGTLSLPFTGEPADSVLTKVELSGYDGKTVVPSGNITVDRERRRVNIPMPLERGFYEVYLPELNFRCGAIVAPELSVKPDPYFAIDTAISGFRDYADPATEESALLLLKRCGIGTVRDRLVWPAIEPSRNQFDFHCSPPLPVDVDRSCGLIRKSGIRMLNVFHAAPVWTGIDRESGEKISYPYPRDLVAVAESWKTIAGRWGDLWDALEVWNEPEIGFGGSLPGDRVAAVQHAVSYALAEAGLPIRISGGVFTGYARGDSFFGPYIENGVFDDADLFSLHDYLEPERFEHLISAHRQMLEQTSQPGIPIWITECGMPWMSKSLRAQPNEDRASAVAIAGKSFEGKACGVDRMFMFVYSFYQEGGEKKNFGFCDSNFTPQRTMAVYAWSAELLANRNYCGDVKVEGAQLSRAFSDGKECVLALLSRSGSVTLPENLKPEAVYDIDGRPLPLPAGRTLAVPNKIAYLTLPESRLRKFLQTDTRLRGCPPSSAAPASGSSGRFSEPDRHQRKFPPVERLSGRGRKDDIPVFGAQSLGSSAGDPSGIDSPGRLRVVRRVAGRSENRPEIGENV